MNNVNAVNNAVNCTVATTLMATPWWVSLLHAVNDTLSTVSVLCGAIIGITTVYRMYRKRVK